MREHFYYRALILLPKVHPQVHPVPYSRAKPEVTSELQGSISALASQPSSYIGHINPSTHLPKLTFIYIVHMHTVLHAEIPTEKYINLATSSALHLKSVIIRSQRGGCHRASLCGWEHSFGNFFLHYSSILILLLMNRDLCSKTLS